LIKKLKILNNMENIFFYTSIAVATVAMCLIVFSLFLLALKKLKD